MSLGISIPTLTGLPLAELVAAAVTAEASGADTVWIPESWCLDPFGVLHAAGSATARLRLATGVAVIAGRAPTVTAMAAQTLAQAFPGRVVLGLGAGHRETVEGWLGVPYEGTVAAMREYVAVVRQVWSGQALSAAGTRWPVADFRSAAPPGPPPRLFLAALGRRMQELVADAADGAILTMATPNLVREAAGRLPGRKLAASFLAGLEAEDEERARRSIAVYGFWRHYRRHLVRLGHQPAAERLAAAWAEVSRAAWAAGEVPPMATAAVPDRLVDQLAAFGPAAIAARAEAYRSAGATEVVLRPLAGSGRLAARSAAVLHAAAPAAPS